MKCDELKRYGMADPAIDNEYEMYKVKDVDEAIKELKSTYKESVEVKVKIWERCKKAEDELRKTQRALWLARAWRAESVMEYLTMKCRYFEKLFGKDVPKCDVDLLAKWTKIIPKCRAKAEEY